MSTRTESVRYPRGEYSSHRGQFYSRFPSNTGMGRSEEQGPMTSQMHLVSDQSPQSVATGRTSASIHKK